MTASEQQRLPGPADLPHRSPGDAEARARLRQRLRTEITAGLAERVAADEAAGRPPLTAQERRVLAEQLGRRVADAQACSELGRGGVLLDHEIEQRVLVGVLDDLLGLGGLEPLLADEAIENINITGCDRVFVRYHDGRRARLAPVVATDGELVELIRELAARSGVEERRFDRAAPIVNLVLADGARLSAVMAVTARPSLSIRRHRLRHVSLAQLRANGTITVALENLLGAMVRARKNIVISGAAAAGKTTLLRALAAEIPVWERLITVEDVAELRLDDDARHPDRVALQAREPNVEGVGAVSAAELVWQSLRMSPDRVLVGEVRGAEVIPMLAAMSMGTDGSLSTVHASASDGVFLKLAAYAAQAERLPFEATAALIAAGVDMVVHLDSPRGQPSARVVSSIREVTGVDGAQVISNEIWAPGPDRRAVPAAPLRERTVEQLCDYGYNPALASSSGWSP
ncbi:CpaF family protein [Allokutzneria albata]|uniref:Pilus assembly protein, ATPase of CpaF family n=1 Tax=Allokutzneria albata TaxID=211114 RepID=A0A1G9YA62_ALLAB|nr:ATPase, T2SS/T4P/T4SS family [Allokutzneria albata]SDN05942.1 Pilus assembly protein, ATPase of CpaF family [Allokutzneria albata]